MQDALKIQKARGKGAGPWLRFLVSSGCLAILVYFAFHFRTCTYLLRQGSGQLRILVYARVPQKGEKLNARAANNLAIVEELKRYSVDSLGYDPTANYTKLYNHGTEPVLWVVTASESNSLQAVYWSFPVVGRVSYKGFFDKKLAAREYARLRGAGYDVEVSPVIAYSSLGWLNDPLFSGMLERSKGSFCNLIFHELFHATYYEAGNVNLNENLASFIAHKATLRFLDKDTAALHIYLNAYSDQQLLRRYLQRQAKRLSQFYSAARPAADINHDKDSLFIAIADSVLLLPLNSGRRAASRSKQILAARNAYFVGFAQYESLQDSLEKAFNIIYRRNIKNMVHDLKRR